MPPKTDQGQPLTPAAFHILLALAEQDLHGYGIIKVVSEQSSGTVRLGAGTLYGNLKRFIELDWIEEFEPAPVEGDDERRRYYRITGKGQQVAVAEAQRLDSLVTRARQAQLLPKLRVQS
jgi:DNA-binding PadR family transcriptional regulator